MRSKILGAAALTAVLLLGACGDAGDGGGSAAGSSDQPSVRVEAPADGAKVTDPFTVSLSSSEPLGPTDTGEHHVHLYYDGSDKDYDVVEADSFEVGDLAPGEHTIVASLRNADHSDAGAEDEITVTVKAAKGTTEGEGENDTGDGDGNGYDY